MTTTTLPRDATVPATPTAQDRPAELRAKTPQAFYAKMVTRPDVREILTRLAAMDEEERQ